MSFTLWEEYYDLKRYAETDSLPLFEPKPFSGHLLGRPTPPSQRDKEDACGVLAGTTNHLSRPCPHIKAHIEGGKLVCIEGGGRYGDAWWEILEATRNIRYPEYPDEGLFWWWELGIGTHPKASRPSNSFTLSGGGSFFERLRSGLICTGFGTAVKGPSEKWAAERKYPYGHLHIHLLFPT